MRAAIFDLDGTLADTSADLIAAANACFGSPMLDPDADKATAFKGGRAMLRLGLSRGQKSWGEADIDRLFPQLLDFYEENIHRETALYENVEDVLTEIAGEGWALGVCTNKPEQLAEKLLRSLGVRDRFGALIGADTLATRKPDAAPVLETVARVGGAPQRAVLIGDTVTDREAARAAGVLSILVTFGPEGDAVALLNPDALLDSYNALPALLKDLAI